MGSQVYAECFEEMRKESTTLDNGSVRQGPRPPLYTFGPGCLDGLCIFVRIYPNYE